MANTPRDALITVGASSIEVSPEIYTGKRVVVVITNVSTGGQVVTLAVGKEATAGTGIVLYPTGAWAESEDASFKPTKQRITAIASAAGGAVTIHERVE